jgi:hypothetical protein
MKCVKLMLYVEDVAAHPFAYFISELPEWISLTFDVGLRH